MKVVVKCSACGVEILKESKHIVQNEKNGHKNYCSKACSNVGQKTRVISYCKKCGKRFERRKSSVERNKSGNYFCSRTCSASFNNQGINRWKSKGVGVRAYRQRALNHYGASCKVCGYNIEPCLEVHHVDGNRRHNQVENLMVLCPTHHTEIENGVRDLPN